jgi:hypothetical protein
MPGTSNFPTGLDSFPDIAANTPENESGKEHDVVHNNEMAAILALQTKVGIDGSADTGSLDYRVSALEAGGGAGVAVAVRFVAELANTTDSDPGAGLLKWNHATQASATQLYLDDLAFDGVNLEGLWAALIEGGFLYLQHATDPDLWQIWVIDTVVDATGYAKLTVTLAASGGSFADGDGLLVTLENGPGTEFAPLAGAAFTGAISAPAVSDPLGNVRHAPLNALSISSGTVNIDCAAGDYFTLALTANVTSLTFSNLPASGFAKSIAVRLRQDGTGGRTVALPSSFKALGGSDTAVASGANAYTMLTATTFDQGTRWEYAMQEIAA